MRERGVTLVELVVVVAIIAIGAAFVAPNIGGWIPRYRVGSATRDVVSIMRTAQMKAISTNTPYGVAFDNGSCILYRSSGGFSAEGEQVSLPTGVMFNNNTFPVNGTLGKPYAEFNTNSTSSSGGVTLTSSSTKVRPRRITLTSSTGRIHVN
jgi:prepilin-type N-terminal cleavage/methylation domain-containing protein